VVRLMKKVYCPECGREMKLVSQGNVNRNLQRKTSKGGWSEVKQLPRYRVEFKCRKRSCRNLVFEHTSKAKAMRLINIRFDRRRHELLAAAKEERLEKEAKQKAAKKAFLKKEKENVVTP